MRTANQRAVQRRVKQPVPQATGRRISGPQEGNPAAAARALLAAGPVTNFTLEQAQVTDCIAELMREGCTPTRVLLRTRALETAKVAMCPGDGASPIVYSLEADLRPRFVSPSPAVHNERMIRRVIETRRIAFVKVGRHVRFRERDVTAAIHA